MKRTHRALIALATLALIISGCGDGDDTNAGNNNTGGQAGNNTGGQAGNNTGGQAGNNTGGQAGNNTGGQAGNNTGGQAGSASATLYLAGTDFVAKTEIVSIDLGTQTQGDSFMVPDGDVILQTSRGLGFALSRNQAKIYPLSKTSAPPTALDVSAGTLGVPGKASTNPSAIVVSPNGNDAYVLFYGANKLGRADLATNKIVETIDLGAYLDATDGDGNVDAASAIYSSADKRLYFTLQRIDVTTIAAPDFQLACPQKPSLLLALDTLTHKLADLNGSAQGQGLALKTTNPVDLSLDPTGQRLLILSAGCFDKGKKTRAHHGIEAVNITNLQSSILLNPSEPDFLSRLIYLGGNQALVQHFDSTFKEFWSRLELGKTFGPNLKEPPTAAVWDKKGSLFGTRVTSAKTTELVEFSLSQETHKVLLANPYTLAKAKTSSAALVAP